MCECEVGGLTSPSGAYEEDPEEVGMPFAASNRRLNQNELKYKETSFYMMRNCKGGWIQGGLIIHSTVCQQGLRLCPLFLSDIWPILLGWLCHGHTVTAVIVVT